MMSTSATLPRREPVADDLSTELQGQVHFLN